MKKLSFVLIFLIIFLIGCGNKNYHYINSIKKDYNIKKENSSIILCHKNFNPSKKVFAKLNNILSDDFIYIYSWVNHLPMAGTNHFTVLVYDRKSNKPLYVSNTLEDTKSISIKENATGFEEEQLILKYYLEKNIDALISLPPAFSSSEVGSEYYLFDSVSKEAYVVKNLILNNDGEIFK